MLKIASVQTAEQLAEYKRGEKGTHFTCKHCRYQAYITVHQAEAHEETCKGRKPKVFKKKR